jgi:hypothetical protein
VTELSPDAKAALLALHRQIVERRTGRRVAFVVWQTLDVDDDEEQDEEEPDDAWRKEVGS